MAADHAAKKKMHCSVRKKKKTKGEGNPRGDSRRLQSMKKTKTRGANSLSSIAKGRQKADREPDWGKYLEKSLQRMTWKEVHQKSSHALRKQRGLLESRLQLSKGPRNQRTQSMLMTLRVALWNLAPEKISCNMRKTSAQYRVVERSLSRTNIYSSIKECIQGSSKKEQEWQEEDQVRRRKLT